MKSNFNLFLPEEEELYNQIKSYYESQKFLKELIQKNITKEVYLYLINEKWLDNWKKYTCYEEIKNNLPLKDINKWRLLRKKTNIEQSTLIEMNNKDLLQFNNSSINIPININPNSNFHLVTKECFYNFTKNNTKKNIEAFKLKFESINKKIIILHLNKIYLIYLNNNIVNFVLFIIDNPNIKNDYMNIKQSNMKEYLEKLGIDTNTEKIELNINQYGCNYIIKYINKSFKNNKNKEIRFRKLINYLIIFESKILNNSYNNEKGIISNVFLINEDWLEQFKLKLNYLNILNQKQTQRIEEIINKMINQYNINNINYQGIEEINPKKKIYYYLKDNNSGNIFKIYSDYSLLDKEIWKRLIKFFNWNIEINKNIYFLNNNIILQYDDKNFEIIEIANKNIYRQLIICLYENYDAKEIINEIRKIGIHLYFQKYNINILMTKESSQKLNDYCNNKVTIGVIINIKAAKNNSNDFTFLNYEELDDNNLNLGLNINNELNNKIINNALNNNDYNNKLLGNVQNNYSKEKNNLKKNNINNNNNKKENYAIVNNYHKKTSESRNQKIKHLKNSNSVNNIFLNNNLNRYKLDNVDCNIKKLNDDNNMNNDKINLNENNINLNNNNGMKNMIKNNNMNISIINENNMFIKSINNQIINNNSIINNNNENNIKNININDIIMINNMKDNMNDNINKNVNSNIFEEINNMNNINNKIMNDFNINNMNNNMNINNTDYINNMNNVNINNNNNIDTMDIIKSMNNMNINNKNIQNINNNDFITNNNNIQINNNMNNIKKNINNMNNINNNMNNINNNINNMNIINNNINNNNNVNSINININENNINNINNFNFNGMNNQINNINNFNFIDMNNQMNNLNINNQNNNMINININFIKPVIDCLSNCEELTQYFLDPIKINEYNNSKNIFPITSAYSEIINQIYKNPANYIFSIKQLKNKIEQKFNCPSFEPKIIYKFIIENIHEEIKNPIVKNNNLNNINQINMMRFQTFNLFFKNRFEPENTSIISNNYFGINEIEIICSNCSIPIYEYEIFNFIEFSIEEIYAKLVYKANMLIQNDRNKSFINLMNNLYKNTLTLNDLVDYYVNFSQQKNNYSCNQCCIQGLNSVLNYKLFLLPNILCLILNRENKIKIKVVFSEILDLSKYVEEFVKIKIYELIGIIAYKEENKTYYAMSKNRIDKDWYLYNNENKSKINIKDAYNQSIPYMLFYQKK